MNKVLLFSLLCIFCSVNSFAGNPVSVKSGSAAVLKNPSNALLEIDYSAAKVGGQTLDEYLQGRGDDFVRDWPRDKATAATFFVTQFNKKNKKGMQVTTDAVDVSYKLVIHVNSLDMGNGASALMPFAPADAGGTIMSGTIEIINKQTNEVVCVLNVDEVKGNGVPSESARLGLMYFQLATQICNLKVK